MKQLIYNVCFIYYSRFLSFSLDTLGLVKVNGYIFSVAYKYYKNGALYIYFNIWFKWLIAENIIKIKGDGLLFFGVVTKIRYTYITWDIRIYIQGILKICHLKMISIVAFTNQEINYKDWCPFIFVTFELISFTQILVDAFLNIFYTLLIYLKMSFATWLFWFSQSSLVILWGQDYVG